MTFDYEHDIHIYAPMDVTPWPNTICSTPAKAGGGIKKCMLW